MEKKWYTYILASQKNWTLYVWVTSNLEKRIYEHKNWIFEWFTKKYGVHQLMRYQEFPTIIEAIEYEKIIKKRRREKKINLIEKWNPKRIDLSANW
jgi:putative endonuclease